MACGSGGKNNERNAAGNPPPISATPTDAAPASASPSDGAGFGATIGWRWRTGDDQHRHVGPLGAYVFAAGSAAAGPSVRLEDDAGAAAWTAQLDAADGDHGALLLNDQRLVVAQHPFGTTGGVVIALDAASGAELWRVDLLALGPIDHNRYGNTIQLALIDGQLAVFGSETQGKYIEVIDPNSGARISNRRLSDDPIWNRLASIPWAWQGTARTWYEIPIEVGGAAGRRYRFTNEERLMGDQLPERAFVERIDGDTALWTAELRPYGSCGNAALAEIAELVLVVYYCSISSGAELYAFDVDSGAQRYMVSLVGIGPIGHSKYYNEVRVASDAGYLIVYGNEAFGRYIEVIDPTTGTLVANQSFGD